MVRELFRDQAATEFIIATIPTVLGINESARLMQALRKERIPCKRIIVNQVRRRGPPRLWPRRERVGVARARARQRLGSLERRADGPLAATTRAAARRQRPATKA